VKLTLETADIASAKIEEIVVKHKSIQEEIRNSTKTYPFIYKKDLPRIFEGFAWEIGYNTMFAIRGENLDFQIVIMHGRFAKYISNMQAIRKFVLYTSQNRFVQITKTEESIRLTKTINNTESKITLNAHIIA